MIAKLEFTRRKTRKTLKHDTRNGARSWLGFGGRTSKEHSDRYRCCRPNSQPGCWLVGSIQAVMEGTMADGKGANNTGFPNHQRGCLHSDLSSPILIVRSCSSTWLVLVSGSRTVTFTRGANRLCNAAPVVTSASREPSARPKQERQRQKNFAQRTGTMKRRYPRSFQKAIRTSTEAYTKEHKESPLVISPLPAVVGKETPLPGVS